jgi:hypothetical protein
MLMAQSVALKITDRRPYRHVAVNQTSTECRRVQRGSLWAFRSKPSIQSTVLSMTLWRNSTSRRLRTLSTPVRLPVLYRERVLGADSVIYF